MTLVLSVEVLRKIQRDGEMAYPEEGAGFLLGAVGSRRLVIDIIGSQNLGMEGARHNRYLIGADEYLGAEQEAERRSLQVLGVFHSHPDHPEEPSVFDKEWAQPNFSYVITSIRSGKAEASKSWLLSGDRSRFDEEVIQLTE